MLKALNTGRRGGQSLSLFLFFIASLDQGPHRRQPHPTQPRHGPLVRPRARSEWASRLRGTVCDARLCRSRRQSHPTQPRHGPLVLPRARSEWASRLRGTVCDARLCRSPASRGRRVRGRWATLRTCLQGATRDIGLGGALSACVVQCAVEADGSDVVMGGASYGGRLRRGAAVPGRTGEKA